MSLIYLDNNSTTAMCQEAIETLMQYAPLPLNPSSTHQIGRKARSMFKSAIDTFAKFLGCKSEQILVTSGATEAINTYLWHLQNTRPPARILTSACEHAAVLQPLRRMQKAGWKLEFLPVDSHGNIDLQDLENRLGPDVGLLAFMAVNNETGVCHPVEAIARLAEQHQVEFLVDAVAAAGKHPIFMHPGITAMAISAHKFHGPAGIGVLGYRSNNKNFEPLILGGGQQLGKRSGTINISLALAAQSAIETYLSRKDKILEHLAQLQNLFETTLISKVGAQINGSMQRARNVSNLYFPDVDAETLLIQLDQAGIIASHGSACQAGALELSHVLLAMHSPQRARASLRFSFAHTNTLDEVEQAIHHITKAVQAQRALSMS